jgi:hypothetical protein
MKSSHYPYYSLPDYYFQSRPDDNMMNMADFQTGFPMGSPMNAPMTPMGTPIGSPMTPMTPMGSPMNVPMGTTSAQPGGGVGQTMMQPPQTAQPADQLAPIMPTTEAQPLTTQSLEFMNGFLRTQIGKNVRVEFLIGTGTLVDKLGRLLAVGANYIVLRQAETDDIIVCDFFSIKFITFYL